MVKECTAAKLEKNKFGIRQERGGQLCFDKGKKGEIGTGEKMDN